MLQLHRSSSTFQSYGAEYRRWQLPILNAFSLTIHKVQRLSLPSVTLALNKNFFSEGQTYVGLIRELLNNKRGETTSVGVNKIPCPSVPTIYIGRHGDS